MPRTIRQNRTGAKTMNIREYSYEDIDQMQQISKTIRQQIGVANLMSCGAREFKLLGFDSPKKGVQFRVNHSAKRHYIKVILEPNDTYTVISYRLKRVTGEHIDIVDLYDIYCENLAETIYRMVNK
jgi:hypothetical protein